MLTFCSNVYGYHEFKANNESNIVDNYSSSEGGKINYVLSGYWDMDTK